MTIERAIAELLKSNEHDLIHLLVDHHKTKKNPQINQLQITNELAHSCTQSRQITPQKENVHKTVDYERLIVSKIIKEWPAGHSFTATQLFSQIWAYDAMHNWFLDGDLEKIGDRERWRIKASDALSSLVRSGVLEKNGARSYVVQVF